MNTREKLSVILLCLGLVLAILPLSSGGSFIVKPQKLLSEVLNDNSYYSVDEVAKFIVNEDSTVQIIDLRSTEEFRMMNIPGSTNIPYSELISKDPGSYLNNGNIRYILYSNGDMNSNFAFTYSRGLNYKNTFVMRGGLNEWFNTIMNSSFTGEKISARENALFETRTRAKKLFTEINSLPDSLKMKFILSKQIAAKKLDGGCE
jgi:rhodanese-related sulfurtransferase